VAFHQGSGRLLLIASWAVFLAACSEGGTAPTHVPRYARLIAVSAGRSQSCGLQPDSTAVCWGSEPLGRVPDSTLNSCPTSGYCVPFAMPVGTGPKFTTISAGSRLTCALAPGNIPWCWGSIGGSDYVTWSSFVPETLLTTISLVSVGSGEGHSCGLTPAGAAYCWGWNYDGELGAGLDENQLEATITPVAVAGGLTFTQLVVGDFHSCGLDAAGNAYCWGSNATGQLGNDTVSTKINCGLYGDACSWSPVPVEGGQTFSTLAAGGGHSCGILSIGALVCWGSNAAGQIGVSDTSHHCGITQAVCLPKPTAVGFPFATADSTISLVTLGGAHSCATTSGGTLFCWGDNQYGQLGIGTMTGFGCPFAGGECRPTPTKVVGLPAGPVSLAAGLEHTCAALASQAAYCWGANESGQLGDNTLLDSPKPTRVQLDTVP
jgi:alpha-tubulin suppressor-like RCC1 family protein